MSAANPRARKSSMPKPGARTPVVTTRRSAQICFSRTLAAAVCLRLPNASLGCVMGAGFSESNDGIRLRALLALHYVELDFIALFERLVSIQLNRRIVDENIWPVFASDESVALGVVKPLDLTFVLSHWLLPSFGLSCCGNPDAGTKSTPIFRKTRKGLERLINQASKLVIK